MSKLDEFQHQLAEVENKILELEELREDLFHRIDEETLKEQEEKTLAFNNEDLHKLLAYLLNTIVSEETVKEHLTRLDLYNFSNELQFRIADMLGYDTEVGNIDPKTLQYYTFESRR